MKALFALAAALTLTACAATGNHDHPAGAGTPPAMHEHMKKMQAQMAQIRAAADPKEKERLMQDHMKTMEESMAKMGGMGCGKM